MMLVQSELLADYPHGFTTRHGGVSLGELASLNLAMRGHEEPVRLEENWRRVVAATPFDGGIDRVALLHQVHGDRVIVVDRPSGVLATVGEADGAVTTRQDVVLAVRTADCVPVLYACPGGVAVAHAGWRGVAAEVVARTLEVLCEQTGVVASHVRVVIGPHISQAAYEVGVDVIDGIARTGVPEKVFVHAATTPHVGLGAAVAFQLERLGVTLLDRCDPCTFSNPNFFSHRRDGAATGRLAGVIARPHCRG